jgi:hypothetical protein
MKDEKVISRGFNPYFFAISCALVFSAVICGSAICFARSYVIAPWHIHSLMVCNSLACWFIGCSFCPEDTETFLILQGETKKYFMKSVKKREEKRG